MRRPASIVLAALVLLAGCAPGSDPAEPLSPDARTQRCSNAFAGYEVAYPADWRTNGGDVMAECSVFHPEPFELEPATEIPLDLAVRILLEDVPFETVAAPPGERQIRREDLEVDGRRAVRVEAEVTDAAAIPAGTTIYRYVVDAEARTLIASAYDLGDVSYEEKKRTLDRMMRSLRFMEAESEQPVGTPRTEPYETAGFPSSNGPTRLLTAVRVAGHAGFDRVVFEFADAHDAPGSASSDQRLRGVARVGDRARAPGPVRLHDAARSRPARHRRPERVRTSLPPGAPALVG